MYIIYRNKKICESNIVNNVIKTALFKITCINTLEWFNINNHALLYFKNSHKLPYGSIKNKVRLYILSIIIAL